MACRLENTDSRGSQVVQRVTRLEGAVFTLHEQYSSVWPGYVVLVLLGW